MTRNVVKFFICIISFLVILFLFVFLSGINEPPLHYNKTVLDIRNKSNETINDMFLKAEGTEKFMQSETIKQYCEEIYIPEIKNNNRIIVILDQSKISVPGMKLRLKSSSYDDYIVDELHEDVGSLHVVTIAKDRKVKHTQIYNTILQKPSLFYWKPYDAIYKLPETR